MREPICGVYKIVCIKNNKIYIGSSVDMINRWWDHKSRLNSNIHKNPRLQNSWNKYGEKNFLFDIVEICSEDKALAREQCWLDKTKCYDSKIGFNISKDTTVFCDNAKEWIVTTPKGKELLIKNLTKFCRKRGLSTSGMSHVFFGRASQYKGWLCRASNVTKEQWQSTRRSSKHGGGWKGKYKITHPDGKEEIVESLTGFCKIYGLSQGNMAEVSKGRRKQHLGYRCERHDDVTIR